MKKDTTMNRKELQAFFKKIIDNKQFCFAIIEGNDKSGLAICLGNIKKSKLGFALDEILDNPKSKELDDFILDYMIERSFEKLLFKIKVAEEKRKQKPVN